MSCGCKKTKVTEPNPKPIKYLDDTAVVTGITVTEEMAEELLKYREQKNGDNNNTN